MTTVLPLIGQAYALAAVYHVDQRRKYTGEPYICHPVEVQQLLQTHFGPGRDAPHLQQMYAAALLHDVLEDTYATETALAQYMPPEVVRLVVELTDVSRPEDGNRAARKALDRAHIASGSPAAQTIKYCDVISNTRSIAAHDPKFSRVYMQEMVLLLQALDKGDLELRQAAIDSVGQACLRHGMDPVALGLFQNMNGPVAHGTALPDLDLALNSPRVSRRGSAPQTF